MVRNAILAFALAVPTAARAAQEEPAAPAQTPAQGSAEADTAARTVPTDSRSEARNERRGKRNLITLTSAAPSWRRASTFTRWATACVGSTSALG